MPIKKSPADQRVPNRRVFENRASIRKSTASCDQLGLSEPEELDLETVNIGEGRHFIQEDQPDAIGQSIAQWMEHMFDSNQRQVTHERSEQEGPKGVSPIWRIFLL